MFSPLDLIYLDEDCRVIEAVESYPTFLASPSRPRAASVLVLPAHSIYSSQTQMGDQLVLCVAEEMGGASGTDIGTAAPDRDDSGVVQGAVLLREQPLWSGGPGLLELGARSDNERGNRPPTHEMSLIEPGIKAVRPPKNWLERWWSPDPRRAPRELGARTGRLLLEWRRAQGHTVRDISSTGLYVVTEERWYPGTLVLDDIAEDWQGRRDRRTSDLRNVTGSSLGKRWGGTAVHPAR